MKSLYRGEQRGELRERLGRITPETPARWGRFDAARMVVHCSDALRMSLGRIPAKRRRYAIRYPPLKQLVVYVLPWPKGAPTAPELLERTPTDWEAEVATLLDLLDAAGTVPRDFEWPEHPAFGRMSRRAWGVLGYRHLDHHLRQFGA